MKIREQGFTLIEMAVVLAIIAVLAAVLTPIVTGYLDQARVVRATADVRTITDAIRQYQRDTGYFPVYASLADARLDTPAVASYLVGPGSAPAVASGVSLSWPTFTSTTSLGLLNNNLLGLSTGSQVGAPGRVAFRGPYVTGIETDPWGNQYVITAANLLKSSANWALVISAGPNGTIDTNGEQANTSTVSVLGDDIVSVIK